MRNYWDNYGAWCAVLLLVATYFWLIVLIVDNHKLAELHNDCHEALQQAIVAEEALSEEEEQALEELEKAIQAWMKDLNEV